MSVYKHSTVWIVIAALSALTPVAYVAVPMTARAGAAVATSADTTQGEQSADEMLQDGLDAVIDRQAGLATQLFQQLIAAYPASPEAARAQTELDTLNGASQAGQAGDDNMARPLLGLRERTSDVVLRLKFATEAGDRVFFAENSAVIGGRARALIDHQARWLAARPDIKMTIIGRADDGASAEESRALSEKRAEAVRERLQSAGIGAERIAIEASGTHDPVATCHSTLCQAQNRHAETSISLLPLAGATGRVDRRGAQFGEADGSGQSQSPAIGAAAQGPAPAGVRGDTVAR